MKIYTLLVDPERGGYLAISTTDPSMISFSHTSTNDAVGSLVSANPGIIVDEVVEVDWSTLR
jgi:hypothetical protein